MKKKALALAMIVGVLALVIGGCSKPADDTTATAGAATAGATAGTPAATAGATAGTPAATAGATTTTG